MSTQPQNLDCDSLRESIIDLKNHLAEYNTAFEDALAQTKNSSNPNKLDTAFDECKRLKNLIRTIIRKIEIYAPLTVEQKKQLAIMEKRYSENPERHRDMIEENITWKNIYKRLRADPSLIDNLRLMEETGGEPDIVWYDMEMDYYYAFDCSPESPEGRRDLVYDIDTEELMFTEEERKERPRSVESMAEKLGIEIMDVTDYEQLQHIGGHAFDRHSSTWIRNINDEYNECEADETLVGQRSAENSEVIETIPTKTTEQLESRGFRGTLAI